jgi:hypothetical protein
LVAKIWLVIYIGKVSSIAISDTTNNNTKLIIAYLDSLAWVATNRKISNLFDVTQGAKVNKICYVLAGNNKMVFSIEQHILDINAGK